jgi:hypothetical protein
VLPSGKHFEVLDEADAAGAEAAFDGDRERSMGTGLEMMEHVTGQNPVVDRRRVEERHVGLAQRYAWTDAAVADELDLPRVDVEALSRAPRSSRPGSARRSPRRLPSESIRPQKVADLLTDWAQRCYNDAGSDETRVTSEAPR